MFLARFLLQDSLRRVPFFEESFLLADTNMEVVLGRFFFALSNPDFQFSAEKPTWSSYSTANAVPTTSWVELIDKREFAKTALDENLEAFVMHVSALDVAESLIHPFWAAQIAALQWDKAPTKIPAEYSDYADVFSSDFEMELAKNIGINKHAIELIEGKQPPYGPIYALNLVELETLKASIKTHLKIRFIRPSKSPASAPILFDKKPDDSLHLCVNYRGLNNLTIKNRYHILLIYLALDRLCRAKWFTQLDLTSTYHRIKIW